MNSLFFRRTGKSQKSFNSKKAIGFWIDTKVDKIAEKGTKVQNYFFTKGFKKYEEFKNGIKSFLNAFS